MRVCVVGGTGNISFGIVNAVLHEGHEVTVYVRGDSPETCPLTSTARAATAVTGPASSLRSGPVASTR